MQPSPVITSHRKSREAVTPTLGCVSLCVGLFGYSYGGLLGLDWLVIWALVSIKNVTVLLCPSTNEGHKVLLCHKAAGIASIHSETGRLARE